MSNLPPQPPRKSPQTTNSQDMSTDTNGPVIHVVSSIPAMPITPPKTVSPQGQQEKTRILSEESSKSDRYVTPSQITPFAADSKHYPIYMESAKATEQGKNDATISAILGGAGLVTLLTGVLGVWFFFVPFILSGMALVWAKKARENNNSATLGRILGWIGVGTAFVGVLVVGVLTGLAALLISSF